MIQKVYEKHKDHMIQKVYVKTSRLHDTKSLCKNIKITR